MTILDAKKRIEVNVAADLFFFLERRKLHRYIQGAKTDRLGNSGNSELSY